MGPIRKLNILNTLSIRTDSQVQVHFVLKKVTGVHEELRDQLFNVCRVRIATLPLFVDSFEHSVWIVEPA